MFVTIGVACLKKEREREEKSDRGASRRKRERGIPTFIGRVKEFEQKRTHLTDTGDDEGSVKRDIVHHY